MPSYWMIDCARGPCTGSSTAAGRRPGTLKLNVKQNRPNKEWAGNFVIHWNGSTRTHCKFYEKECRLSLSALFDRMREVRSIRCVRTDARRRVRSELDAGGVHPGRVGSQVRFYAIFADRVEWSAAEASAVNTQIRCCLQRLMFGLVRCLAGLC